MDDPALLRFQKTQDHADQGRLARAALSHQAQDLAAADLEIHVVQDFLIGPVLFEQGALPVAAADMLDLQDHLLTVLLRDIQFLQDLRIGIRCNKPGTHCAPPAFMALASSLVGIASIRCRV